PEPEAQTCGSPRSRRRDRVCTELGSSRSERAARPDARARQPPRTAADRRRLAPMQNRPVRRGLLAKIRRPALPPAPWDCPAALARQTTGSSKLRQAALPGARPNAVGFYRCPVLLWAPPLRESARSGPRRNADIARWLD